jgi:outer membrane protein assembly factor BamE (lipoprotein component of BamABCDE complex)
MFKKLTPKSILLLAVLTSLMGCVYKSNIDYGQQFTSEQINQIEKKVTMTSDLLKIFGEPAIKSVISETEEKWVYTYTGGTASAQAFTMKTTSNISTHILDILITNGVVVNFAETNNVHNMNTSVQ